MFEQASIYSDNPEKTFEECFGINTFKCMRELVEEIV